MDALQLAGALALVALSLVGLVIGVRDERRRHRAEVWSRHGTPRTVSIRYPRGGWSGQAPGASPSTCCGPASCRRSCCSSS
ncbi:hypothetical protein ACFQY4_28695 [Catellatospora bangladeshensis]|uniref:hypothetical protein n=1 Tax=Catellatospora bangladeshensis TaxID=310355 RepID=UPI00360FC9C0